MSEEWYAARALASGAAALPAESVPLAAADGRTLAAPQRALTDLPAFDTAAMDGWAVAGEGPWQITGEVLAGSAPTVTLTPGAGCVIATGAAVPSGATAVIKREDGHVADGVMSAAYVRGSHIRPAGEECRAGEVLIDSGTVVTPAIVGLLAAAGIDAVEVRRIPRVVLLLFGDELVDAGVAGVGQVRDALGPQLPGWVRRLGADVVELRRVEDTLEAHVAALREAAASADVVMTTGGTAAGPVDHLHAAVTEIGGRFVVDSVAVRPGHPMALAQVAQAWLLALPGNPQSAIVSLLTLGQPLFDALLGRRSGDLPQVTLSQSATAPAHERRLLACELSGITAAPVQHLGSAMLRGLAIADGFAVLPPGGAAAGASVAWLALP